ncbi:hypothetical protein [Arthrobacter alpinus]|nr:hypothetical protein [Arthrobacter alpinus]
MAQLLQGEGGALLREGINAGHGAELKNQPVGQSVVGARPIR